MNIKRFQATLKDGSIVDNSKYVSVVYLPHWLVTEIKVDIEVDNNPIIQTFIMKSNPDVGERLHFFIRHSISWNSGVERSRSDTFVMELNRGNERLARLYWSPNSTPIFTTEDVYF